MDLTKQPTTTPPASRVSADREHASFFVSDRALDVITASGDTFEFKAVADTLVTLVASAEPPFSIALLGPWGSGKTTLVNDVLQRLRATPQRSAVRRIAEAAHLTAPPARDLVVYVDAWKYDAESLRRQLLLELERACKDDGFLDAKAQPVSERLYQQATTSEVAPPRLRWTSAPPAFALLAAMWVISIAMSIWAAKPLDAIGLALLQLSAGVTLYVLFQGSELFRRATTTVTQGPLVTPEQFEREFAAFVGQPTVARLILVLDNIDRMTPDAAVATLAMLKTYLEPGSLHKGVFLVPLDDTALRAHLRLSFPGNRDDRGEAPDIFAREYLRKFFAATVRVPPLSTGEMVAFVEVTLAEITPLAELPTTTRRRIAQLLASVPSTTPRRAKRHLNALSARLAILDARSAAGEIRVKDKPQNVLCLAMLTVIEEEWPDLFAALAEHPGVLREWRAQLLQIPGVGGADPQGRAAADALRVGSAALFVATALRRVELDDVRTLIRLKLDATESRVDDYQGFVDELTQGNASLLGARIGQLGEGDRRAHLEVAFRVLDEQVGRTYFDNAAAVAAVVVESRDAWGEALGAELAAGAAERYAEVAELRQTLLTSLSPRGSVWLASRAAGTERASIVGQISRTLNALTAGAPTGARTPTAEEAQRIVAVAMELAPLADRFDAAELAGVRDAMALLPAEQSGLEFVSANAQAAALLTNRAFFSKRIARVFVDPATPLPAALDPLFAQRPADWVELYADLVAAIEAWLAARAPGEAIAPTVESLSVRRWPLGELPRELLTRYRAAVQGAWAASVQDAAKAALAREVFRLRSFVDGDDAADDAVATWMAGQPHPTLVALGAPTDATDGQFARDLVLQAMRTRGLASGTPKPEVPQLAASSLEVAAGAGPSVLLQAAADWVGVAVDEVAQRVDAIVPALALDASGAERFEARLLEQLDVEPTPPAALAILAKLPRLHAQNPATLLGRLHDQLRTRARRPNGELVLAGVGHLLGDQAATLWQRLAEETRDQLYGLLREGRDWSDAAEELDLLARHRTELPSSARAELLRVLASGATSQLVAVRRDALRRSRDLLAREEAQQVLDKFADRLEVGASIAETTELIDAIDALGATDRAVWKLGEIAASGSDAATIADAARVRVAGASR